MQMVHMAMGHNHIQVGALSSDTRMATLPMPNTGPRCTAHQSAMPLSPLHDTTLYTTRPGNHYPNYTVADHEGSTGTPRTSDAPFLPCMTQLSIQPGTQPLPQLYCDRSRRFRRNAKNIKCTLYPDLSMKSLSPSSAKI